MSYSISATKPTKAELETAIKDQLFEVPKSQPLHEADIGHVFNAAKSLIDLMTDDSELDLHCVVSGSIWKTDAGIQSLGLNINVSYQDRSSQ